METGALDLFFDGCCEPRNPGGSACFGWALLERGRLLHKGKGFVCRGEGATNNVAEYSGLIDALAFLLRQGYTHVPVTVRGDSQLVVRQIHGEYNVHSPLLLPLYRQAIDLFARLPQAHLEWIPRERNQLADRLSHEAYRESIATIATPAAQMAHQEASAPLPAPPQASLPLFDRIESTPAPPPQPAGLPPDEAEDARLDLIRAVFAAAREQFGNDNTGRLDWNERITGMRSCWAMTRGQLKTLLISYSYRAAHPDRFATARESASSPSNNPAGGFPPAP